MIYKNGTCNCKYYSCYDSPIGRITLISDGEALIELGFDTQLDYDEISKDCERKGLPIFDETKKWLDIYFEGKDPGFMPPLKVDGTPFRKRVWEILLMIPYGKTVTYGQIAKHLAEKKGIEKMSAQAVGGAVGHNPISIIIPCHRVMGANGKLTGYTGGIDIKVELLKLEGSYEQVVSEK